jgi:hypothetical protein
MTDKHDFKPGDQIVYMPDHANNNLNHPDVQIGFVMSMKDDFAFCRYWRGTYGKPIPELRTKANSEATPYRNLWRLHACPFPQKFIDLTIRRIEEAAGTGAVAA